MARAGEKRGRAANSLIANLTPEQQAMYDAILAGQQDQGPEDPPVYWGQWNDVDPDTGDPVLGRKGIESIQDRTVPATDALMEFDRWNQAKVQAFIREAVRSGLLPKDADYFQAKTLWQRLVQEAVDKTAAGQKMTPWDVMSFAGGNPDAAKSGKPRTITRTESRVDLTDPDTARSLVHDVLSDRLGRRANQEEVDDFVSALHSYEKANPTVSTTTSRYGREGRFKGSETVSQGGATSQGAQQVIQDEVEETPEYASYQAAGIYFPLLEQALGATANVQGR